MYLNQLYKFTGNIEINLSYINFFILRGGVQKSSKKKNKNSFHTYKEEEMLFQIKLKPLNQIVNKKLVK